MLKRGRERLEGVTVMEVDEHRRPIPGTETDFACDTLLLSVGLIPENELSRQAGVPLSPVTGGAVVDDRLHTGVPGIFACGNVLHVHDLVDFVSDESFRAGQAAAAFLRGEAPDAPAVEVRDGEGVRGTVPQRLHPDHDVTLMFRPAGVYKNAAVVAESAGVELARKRAMIFTPGEMATLPLKAEKLRGVTAPVRMVTAVVPVRGSAMPLSVKTRSPIPKKDIAACMEALRGLRLTAPIAAGSTVLSDVCGSGVDVIATKTVD